MGIDVGVLDFLLRHRTQIKGKVLQLGRQGLHIPREPGHPTYDAAARVLAKHDPETSLGDLFNDDMYSEKLFAYLGATEVVSLDAANFEGATHVHDLNTPVPSALRDQCDVIFDGGTVEHIFDVKQVFSNIQAMLKVGGVVLSVNAANNQLGHGFYQFSPELMWRVFSKEAGYRVLAMQTLVITPNPEPVDVEDPSRVGRRIETGMTAGPTYLLVAAEKIEEIKADTPQQSDYASAWKEHA